MKTLATQPTADVHAYVTQLFADECGRIVGTVMRLTGDLDLAEECAQEAVITAL